MILLTGFASGPGILPTTRQCARTTCTRRRNRVHCCVASPTALHATLLTSLQGLNRGLDIDADSEAEDAVEAEVEDAIEALEQVNESVAPTADPLRHGDWVLAYTSSSLSRYAGGLTSMHKLLPGGAVGRISLTVDPDVSLWTFNELLTFEVFGKEFEVNVVIDGKVRALDERREVWSPDKARFFGLSFYAETWKSLRAFTNGTVTYLDEHLKIARGTTGAAVVFVRPQLAIKDE